MKSREGEANRLPRTLRRSAGGRIWPSAALLVVGLCATVVLTGISKKEQAEGAQRDFEFNCSEVQAKIGARLSDCETLLRSGASFWDHAGKVSRAEWRRYIELQEIGRRFPGIQGMGFALLIAPGDLRAHLAEIRAEGFPEYQVRPAGEREVYSSIIHLEPFSGRNLRAFGYDMLSERTRREAMERARDQNATALTGRVKLVQETEEAVQAGTLMYMPVFHSAAAVASPAERRAALLGWVYCPFRMDDLMAGIMEGRNLEDSRQVRLEIFDGEIISREALLHDSMRGGRPRGEADDSLQLQRTIVSAGRPWTLRFTRLGRGPSDFDASKGWLVALGGVSTSLLLSGLLFSLQNTRFHARELAEQLTADQAASEERFRAIADYTVGWETWYGLDGRILWVNPGVERITGYSPSEVLAMPDLAEVMITPRDRDSFRALLKEKIGGSKGDEREFQCRRKDGTMIWLSIAWQPILDRAGNSLGLRTSGRDITRLKQAEASLQRANWAVEQSNTSIMITDSRGDIEYVNAEFTKVTGYAREEVIGRNPRFLQSGRTSRVVYEEMWQALLAGKSWQGEFQNRRKDGEIYWETVAISPLRDLEGSVTHFVALKQDVGERKRLQIALQESLANFRTFFESITDMIFVGDPDGRLIFTNQAVTQTLGYAPDELRKMHVLEVHPRARRTEAEAIFAAMFRGERVTCPLPLAAKDGSLVPVETRVWFGQWNGANCLFGIAKNLSAEQEAQQRFERLFRYNPLLMALSTLPDSRFSDVNDTFLKTLGYDREEILGKTVAELELFPEAAHHAEVAAQLRREGHVANVELSVRRHDGTILVGLFSGEIIRNQGKEYFLTVMNDISQLKRMEAELKASNDRLFLAVQAGGVGTWDLNLITHELTWDDQMLRLYGIARTQFSRRHEDWVNQLHPDDRQRCVDEVRRAVQGGKSFDTEFRVVWPDGSLHDIRALAIVERDPSGSPLRVIGTNWDITAEKLAAATLRWNQELLQLMTAASPLGFLVVDNRTDAILHFNQRFCDIWGIGHLADRLRAGELKNNELIPHCLPVLVDVPAFAASCAPLQDAENRAVIEDEIAFTGNRTIRRFTTQIRDAADRYYGRFYIFEDISERKRREAETGAMLVKQKEISEMKSRFISVTSHEFRTPMTAAMASVELLMIHFDRLAPEKRRELLARIDSSLRRMAGMLDELLMFNRLEQHRVETCLAPLDLDAQLHDLIDEVRLGDRGAHHFEYFAPGGAVLVVSDANLLHHIFSNVLSNAIRYSPAGTRVSVTLEVHDRRVQVAIEDQGIGVPPADRERIFEAFERGSNVGAIRGSGLGLSIVKHMTGMLGGGIQVAEGANGQGSRFTLDFPRSGDGVRSCFESPLNTPSTTP